MGKKTWELVAVVLAGIGALNWGLVSIFSFDLVQFAFQWAPVIVPKIVYGAVGISGLYTVYKALK